MPESTFEKRKSALIDSIITHSWSLTRLSTDHELVISNFLCFSLLNIVESYIILRISDSLHNSTVLLCMFEITDAKISNFLCIF